MITVLYGGDLWDPKKRLHNLSTTPKRSCLHMAVASKIVKRKYKLQIIQLRNMGELIELG